MHSPSSSELIDYPKNLEFFMSAQFLIQFAIVLLCILLGARVGGIGLGVFGL